HFYRFLQTFGDLTSLVGNTLTLKFLGFCLCFRYCYDTDSLCFRLVLGGGFFTFCSVYPVHGMLYLLVRINIGYKSLDDVVSITLHSFLKLTFYSNCDIILTNEHIVQFPLWHFCPYHIKYIGGNLIFRILQTVERVSNLLLYYLILYRYFHSNKYVVQCFCVDDYIKLLDTQIHPFCHLIDVRNFEVQSRLTHRMKFTKSFYNRGRSLLHRKK